MLPILNWPGNQINDINEFRDDCFRQCHEQNPTDSGWYEKQDECGRRCSAKLRQFQRLSGKNPCAQRLQAPVYWFDNDTTVTKEAFNYDQADPTPYLKTSSPSQSKLDIIYVISLSAVLLFLLVTIFMTIHGRRKN